MKRVSFEDARRDLRGAREKKMGGRYRGGLRAGSLTGNGMYLVPAQDGSSSSQDEKYLGAGGKRRAPEEEQEATPEAAGGPGLVDGLYFALAVATVALLCWSAWLFR